jgi:hypothetical protein
MGIGSVMEIILLIFSESRCSNLLIQGAFSTSGNSKKYCELAKTGTENDLSSFMKGCSTNPSLLSINLLHDNQIVHSVPAFFYWRNFARRRIFLTFGLFLAKFGPKKNILVAKDSSILTI